MNNFLVALTFCTLAGLSTGIGGIISTSKRLKNKKALAFLLGLSAGFIIYISLIQLIPESIGYFLQYHTSRTGNIIVLFSFFISMAVISFITSASEHVLLNEKHLKELKSNNYNTNKNLANNNSLLKSGIITAIGLAIHNMPEGIITFMSAYANPKLAVSIVIAIALHNIPEGIAVGVQVFHGANNKFKAILYSFLSGMAEVVGALIGLAFLLPLLNNAMYGILFSSVAGIMVFVAINDILPNSYKQNKTAYTVLGFVFGMLIMNISLILLH